MVDCSIDFANGPPNRNQKSRETVPASWSPKRSLGKDTVGLQRGRLEKSNLFLGHVFHRHPVSHRVNPGRFRVAQHNRLGEQLAVELRHVPSLRSADLRRSLHLLRQSPNHDCPIRIRLYQSKQIEHAQSLGTAEGRTRCKGSTASAAPPGDVAVES